MKTHYIQIQTTTKTKEEALNIANILVRQHLVASAQILPHMTSIYIWEEQLCTTDEYLLLLNTTYEREPEVYDAIHQHHSYVVPEYIVLPIQDGSTGYLGWITENVTL